MGGLNLTKKKKIRILHPLSMKFNLKPWKPLGKEIIIAASDKDHIKDMKRLNHVHASLNTPKKKDERRDKLLWR